MRNIFLFCALLCLCMTSSGCWDKVQLENRGFVSAFGIDAYRPDLASGAALRFNSPHFDERFIATVCMPNLQGSEKGGTTKLMAAADALLPALSLVQLGTSQEPYYGQTKAIVLGESLLNDAELMSQAIDAMERNREISRKVVILATDGDAAEILKADIEGEQFGMHVSNFFNRNNTALGIAFKKDLEGVLKDLRNSGGTVIPVASLEGGVISLSGAAMVNNFKLAGWLDDAEVRGLMMARGQGEDAHITVEFDGVRVPLRLSSQRARLKFEPGSPGSPVCFLEIRALGSILEYYANSQNDISSPENVARLNKLFAQAIEREVTDMYARLTESGVDGLGLLEHMRKHNYSLYQEFITRDRPSVSDIILIPIVDVRVTDVGATR